MRLFRLKLGWLVAFSCLVVSAPARELPDSFSLAKYVPGDVWMVIHFVENPDRAFIQEQWAEVWQAAKSARLDQDVMRMLQEVYSRAHKPTQASFDQTKNLLDGIAWADLVARETVFAERRARSGIGYDYLFLARGTEGSAVSNFEGLTKLIQDISLMLKNAIGVDFVQTRKTTPQLDVIDVRLKGVEKPSLSIGIHVFRSGDVIGVVVGDVSFAKVRALLLNKRATTSLAHNPRFLKAMAEVPTPTDSLSYFDMKSFMCDMCFMCDTLAESHIKAAHPKKGKCTPPCKKDVLRRLMGVADVVDYIVSSQRTEGNRETTKKIVRLQPGKQGTELAKAFLERKPFDRFDRFVPADAVSFSVSTSIDLERLFRFAMDFVGKELPDGPASKAWIEGLPAKIGLDLQKDVFDWLGGELINVELPAAVVTPMGGSDHVVMIRTKDSALARKKIDTFIDFVTGSLQSRGQMLMVTSAPLCPEGFRQVIHPMLAMFMKPVVGVYGEWVVIGTSQEAVLRCVSVAEGKAPSIQENTRFRAEGVKPHGPVLMASFEDATDWGENLSQSFAMAGMVGGMVSAQMGGGAQPGSQEVIAKLVSLATKLAPVLRELDFYSSRSSMTTYDGSTKVESTDIVTYKSAETLRSTSHSARTSRVPSRSK